MKAIALCVCALLAASAFASASDQDKLASMLRTASRSSNPSVSFLQGMGSLGNVDMDRATVLAAVNSASVHPTLEAVLGRISRLKVQGSQVNLTFSDPQRVNLANKGYAHLSRDVSFTVNGRTLSGFSGFKLSKTARGPRVKPRSISFGNEAGIPTASVVTNVGTFKFALTTQTAGLNSRLKFG